MKGHELHGPIQGRFHFNRAELWADGLIHVLGIVLGVGAVAYLLVRVVAAAPVPGLMPVAIYSSALMAVLIISAVYNMLPVSPVKWLLRRFDHSAIYVLIAGTYTPFLAKMGESAVAHVLLAVVWIASAAGVVLKVVLPGRYDRVSIALYLLIGWSGVFAWENIAQLPSIALWLIVTGGALYTLGVVFHVWQSLPFQNAIWHAFVLVASGCFYGAVFQAYAITPSG
ncbi:MAG: hemolysin III family protein [Bosea sp.]|uniref:PAQR family membrane homeostasis protein TrhA n=1 Tax=Bosea sp. (in: a-proteobacteria) TaxID=1871050 RepID=UPI0023960C73|nr:hemolysin III family protein [Bosea sp. (in: a-proteobacteria)]MCP4734005.1 hemolysin III family protein [Bosea sp. (in: a-proteobacteria)]